MQPTGNPPGSSHQNNGSSPGSPPGRNSRRRQTRFNTPTRRQVAGVVDGFARSAETFGPTFLTTTVAATGVSAAGAIVNSAGGSPTWVVTALVFAALFAGYNLMFPDRAGFRMRIWGLLQFARVVSFGTEPPGFVTASLGNAPVASSRSIPTVSGTVSGRAQQNERFVPQTCFGRTTEFFWGNHTMLFSVACTLYMIVVTALLLAGVLRAGFGSSVGGNSQNSSTTTSSPSASNTGGEFTTDITALALDAAAPEVVLLVVAFLELLAFVVHLMRRVAISNESASQNAQEENVEAGPSSQSPTNSRRTSLVIVGTPSNSSTESEGDEFVEIELREQGETRRETILTSDGKEIVIITTQV